MTDKEPTTLLRRCAALLRPWKSVAAAVCWVAGAVLAGGVAGWLGTTLILPAAPLPDMDGAAYQAAETLPQTASVTIDVAPLAPPDMPPTSLVLAGPAHAPAELALQMFRFAGGDNAAPPSSDTLPGAPHTGAEQLPQELAQTSEAPATGQVRPDAPHRAGELYLLITGAADLETASHDGAPHAGPPHTMPEVVLLYGALERERAAERPAVAVHATGWIGQDNSNAAFASLPLPGVRPDIPARKTANNDVVSSETGPEHQPESTVPMLPEPGSAPMVAIMIDDLGLNVTRSRRVSELPAPLTMAFIPYGEHLDEQTRLARAAGHEIFLHLPMEPTDPTVDPGPHALVESLDPVMLARELAWNLDRFSGYVGINNHMGSLMTQDRQAMTLVMAELARRGLLFVDSVTSAGSVAYDSAVAAGIPAARRDVFLDNVPEVDAVLAQLDKLEEVARRQGFAIGIGHPHDATIAALAAWLPLAQAKGIMVVPVSRVIESRALILAQKAGN